MKASITITRFVIILTIAGTVSLSAFAQSQSHWPHWRGPQQNGVSDEKNLPTQWSTRDNIHWKLDLPGRSGSTPIVWGDRIFVNVTRGTEIELWCVNRKTGAVMWKKPLGGGNRSVRKANMSTPSPVTDGQSLWVLTSTGLLRRFDMNGQELWLRDVQKDHGSWGLQWGYGSSPVLHQDAIYVQVLHGYFTDDPSYLLRIDKQTGKTIWRVERPTDAIRESPDSYTTPAIVKIKDSYELVVTGGDYVTGHDLATGKELWRAHGLNPTRNSAYRIVASPLAIGDIVVAPTRERPLLVLRAGGRGDVTTSHKLWSTNFGPDVPTPVSDGKNVYIVRDNGVMFCYDVVTGTEVYGSQRLAPGTYSSSPILADGKIYITSEDGLTSVVKAGPQFEVLAQNNLNDYTLSTPVIVNGQIFIRTDYALWAIGKPRDGE
jgi:outer membrane protein assembly factor BamB